MAGEPTGAQPTEEELRAAYEAEIKKIRVEHVLLEHVVTMVNLGMRRTGLSPGTEAERDPGQVELAIESIRRLLPLVDEVAPQQAGPIRDALSQLQMAYVRVGGQPSAEAPSPPSPPAPQQPGSTTSTTRDPAEGAPSPSPAADPRAPDPGQAGPAQRSGRLWVPGQ